VAGRPNWEYKFLNRAVQEDTQVQLVALIRAAKREPKFDFRGRGESSNPLYRGFDNKDDTTERYDQPVLVRQNTRDDMELRGGFPKTAEDLFGYQAIILDDLEAEFFTPDQMTLLQKFVSERGGGFLMLGGQECFQQGLYDRTPIGDLLPVYLDAAAEAKPSTQYRLTLTREGWLQPWARLRTTETDEKSRLAEMPPFEVLNPIRRIKPGASVVSTVTDPSGKTYPALVAQRFGRGRAAALLVGDLWLWGMQDAERHRDLDKAWRQMMRWLVADVPNRIDLQIEPISGDPNQAVQLQVRVRTPQFQPQEDAAVTFAVQRRDNGTNTPPIHLTAEPSNQEPGLYQATFVPRENGAYQVNAAVTNAVGAELGRVQTGWTTDLTADEFRALNPNRSLLAGLARQTGGALVPAANLEAFVRTLPNRKAPITESYSLPAWHQPLFFLFALACLVAEWGLRRWKGLA
jgi:uncharacterized membrane protein